MFNINKFNLLFLYFVLELSLLFVNTCIFSEIIKKKITNLTKKILFRPIEFSKSLFI
jgi:hypothetical protein